MTQVIYKYSLPGRVGYIMMPDEAQILHVGEQDNALFLWALVDVDAEVVEWYINVIGTGRLLHEHLDEHLGTVQMQSGEVWHVFTMVSIAQGDADD